MIIDEFSRRIWLFYKEDSGLSDVSKGGTGLYNCSKHERKPIFGNINTLLGKIKTITNTN